MIEKFLKKKGYNTIYLKTADGIYLPAKAVDNGDGTATLKVDTEIELTGDVYIGNVKVGSTDQTAANAKYIKVELDGTVIVKDSYVVAKLDEVIDAINSISVSVDTVGIKDSSDVRIDPATEGTLQQVRDYLDTVETKLQSILSQLDVELSTRASESTVNSILGQLDITLSGLRDALKGSGNKDFTTLEADVEAVLTQLDVVLSTRASEATLLQVRNYLDTVETKLQSLIDNFDVALSTRATETTVANIYGQLNITLSALRDAITGTSPNNKTLKDIDDILLLIKDKTDNLDVALSTRATEATLALIKTKMDNLDVLLSTRLADNTFTGRMGEVQAAPTANTVLGRLKDLWDKLHDLFITGTAKTKLWDGTEEALIDTDGSQITKKYDNVNRTPLWQRYTLTTTATTPVAVGSYTIPSGWTMCLGCVNLAGERTTPVVTNEIIGTVEFQVTVNGVTWITLNSQVLRSGRFGIMVNQCKLNLHPDTLRVLGNGTIAFRMLVTPADTTSTDWQFIMIGYLYQ